MTETKNPFANAMAQLDTAAAVMNLDAKAYAMLQSPRRVLTVSIPVTMDDGSLKVFTGFRSQYNDALGPYKGGIRFHPGVTLEEVKALSFWMTMKVAVVGLPLGGGKGGVIVEPQRLSKGELERLSRGYIRALYKYVGPTQDVPAPDVYTNAQIMAWMLDEYEQLVGEHAPGMITGKPRSIGGSAGRDTATAQGGVYVLREIVQKLGWNPSETRVAIQGFGNAGAHVARLLSAAGYRIIAVSDSQGGVVSTTSLNIAELSAHKQKTGAVAGFAGTTAISNEALLELDTDILIPAALESVITGANAGNVKAKLLLELANGPVTPEADAIFREKNILSIPDILANAGGVTVSYFEQVQNASNYAWSEVEVATKLETIMVQAANAVWDTKNKYATDMRTAAFVVALERVRDAMQMRGWV